jgi:predicted RNA-binding Zn-ribbon protein involved in translation (DUF1610 family)
VLYRVVRDHLETFCLQSASLRGGEGLPRFVEEEFRVCLRCGWMAAGFARFPCAACGTDRLVAFSCKGRGFCPSCGPSAMLRAVPSGAVAIVQRFGAALNLNVHIHALVLDGGFALGADGRPAFREGDPPSDDDVAQVLEVVRRRVDRLLDRRGHGVDDDGFAPDQWAEEAPVLATMGAAAVLGRAATGPRAGARFQRVGDERRDGDGTDAPSTLCRARQSGFDLHAGVVVPAAHRHRFERLWRYGLRPPVAEERLQVTADGQVLLRLRHRWSDGTTHILFEPMEFLERLAVITPRPRVNLVLYYGVLACPRCGHAMRLIALVEQAEVIRRILRHLGEPTEAPAPAPARAPPPLDVARAGPERAEGPRIPVASV